MEEREKVVDGHGVESWPWDLVNDAAAAHDNGSVAVFQGMIEVMGDHDCGEVVLSNDRSRQLHDLSRSPRAQRRGVLVEEQHQGLLAHSHENADGLTLPS